MTGMTAREIGLLTAVEIADRYCTITAVRIRGWERRGLLTATVCVDGRKRFFVADVVSCDASVERKDRRHARRGPRHANARRLLDIDRTPNL